MFVSRNSIIQTTDFDVRNTNITETMFNISNARLINDQFNVDNCNIGGRLWIMYYEKISNYYK